LEELLDSEKQQRANLQTRFKKLANYSRNLEIANNRLHTKLAQERQLRSKLEYQTSLLRADNNKLHSCLAQDKQVIEETNSKAEKWKNLCTELEDRYEFRATQWKTICDELADRNNDLLVQLAQQSENTQSLTPS
jgi:hypothetical protein